MRYILSVLFSIGLMPVQAQAALSSWYVWEVANSVSVPGAPVSQVFLAEGTDQSTTGQLISFGTTIVDYEDFPLPGGATGSGPVPAITLQAQSTGRILRVENSIKHISSCMPPSCNGVTNPDATWTARWSSNASAFSSDIVTIVGDSSLDGRAGSFLLPLSLTGQIVVDQNEGDFNFSLATTPGIRVESFDQDGNRTALRFRNYFSNITTSIDETFSLVVPFVFNESFELRSSLRASSSAFHPNTDKLFQLTYLEASSDFANTFVLESFTDFIVDNNGDGVPDSAIDPSLLQISSSEGIDYLSDASVIPIPAAAWLFMSGLIGLVGLARNKA